MEKKFFKQNASEISTLIRHGRERERERERIGTGNYLSGYGRQSLFASNLFQTLPVYSKSTTIYTV